MTVLLTEKIERPKPSLGSGEKEFPVQRYVRNDELMWSEVADDIVALDATRGNCFGMGDVSAVVWRLLEQPHTIADLCDELTKLYAVDEDTCRRDVGELVEKMVSEHIVRPVGD